MLVDLARGGWQPEPMERGLWLFPPASGALEWSGVDDQGDGHGPVRRWHLTGQADAEQVVITLTCEAGEGERITPLLRPAMCVSWLYRAGRARRSSMTGGGACAL